jgi:hypothetical protein
MLEAGRNPTSYLNRTSGGGNLCIPRRQASLPWRAFEFSSWGDFLVLWCWAEHSTSTIVRGKRRTSSPLILDLRCEIIRVAHRMHSRCRTDVLGLVLNSNLPVVQAASVSIRYAYGVNMWHPEHHGIMVHHIVFSIKWHMRGHTPLRSCTSLILFISDYTSHHFLMYILDCY